MGKQVSIPRVAEAYLEKYGSDKTEQAGERSK